MSGRQLAVTCLGHSAQLRGEVGSATVMPVLNRLLRYPVFFGRTDDALDDIETFTHHRRHAVCTERRTVPAPVLRPGAVPRLAPAGPGQRPRG